HFAEFVPVSIPDPNDSDADIIQRPHLLGLRTEIVRAGDRVEPEDDYLMRRPKKLGDTNQEIWRLFSLRTPWSVMPAPVYSSESGGRTLKIHDVLMTQNLGKQDGKSMNPKEPGDALDAYPPGFENHEIYCSEKAIYEARFYRDFFKA